MALEFQPAPWDERHVCPLPLPKDPEIPEGHGCECGKRWVYEPAHWEPMITLEELRLRQQAGEFLRSILPTFKPPPSRDDDGVVVPIRTPRVDPPASA